MLDGDQIRERIRIRMAVLGSTQADLCREHDVNPSTFSYWLQRLPDITLTTLERIAEILECDCAWLLGGDLREAMPAREDLPDAAF